MLLSQLTGRPVLDADGERVATVRDVVVRMDEAPHPVVVGLVARRDRADLFVPIAAVDLDEQGVRLTMAGPLEELVRRDGEVLLDKEVMDKPVISLTERKVVRVNDLALEREADGLHLVAADVDPRGLLRRLLPGGFGQNWITPELLDWAEIQYLSAHAPEIELELSHERLAELHPVEIARLVDALSYREGAEIVEALDDATAADTLEELTPERQADILESLDEERAADILEEMAPDDAADLLADLSDEKAEELLERMAAAESDDVRELMAYAEDSAGGMMTTDFVMLPAGITADEAVRRMRSLAVKPDLIYYVYVVRSTDDPELLGVVSLRDLILAEPPTPLDAIMVEDFVFAEPETPARDAARTIAEYNLMALPVLDERGRLVGIITVDDAMELLLPESWRRRIPRIFS